MLLLVVVACLLHSTLMQSSQSSRCCWRTATRMMNTRKGQQSSGKTRRLLHSACRTRQQGPHLAGGCCPGLHQGLLSGGRPEQQQQLLQ